jgi:hypothetical protein
MNNRLYNEFWIIFRNSKRGLKRQMVQFAQDPDPETGAD